MSGVVEAVAQRRFTVQEYHRMAESGILAPDERVELVRGVVREMSPKNRAHVLTTWRVVKLLSEELKGRGSVYREDPLVIADNDSEPEPDVLVCSSPDFDAYGTEATEPVLVIEVSESSLAYDLGDKATLYADTGIPEYWVVNLVDRVLVVLREPEEGGYASRSTLEVESHVSPLAWPDVQLPVSSLFAN